MEVQGAYYIYAVTNRLSGMVYIGLRRGNPETDDYLGSGSAIKRAIQMLGRPNFTREVLCFCRDIKEARFVEATLVTREFIKRPDVYNLVPGGRGSFHFINSRGIPKFKGRRHSTETKERLAEISANRRHTDATIEKLTTEHLRIRNPERWTQIRERLDQIASRPASLEKREKLSRALTGRTLPPEDAAKKRTILAAARQKRVIACGPMSDEQRKKLSESGKLGWEKRRSKNGADHENRTRISGMEAQGTTNIPSPH